MKLIFSADFDGILNIQSGDTLELKILYAGVLPFDYHATIIRQTGVKEPPPLGVSVSEEMGVQERLS